MGKSAKLTRGGNKKRVNVGRQQAKIKALGGKAHTSAFKEASEAKLGKKLAIDNQSKKMKESVKAYAATNKGSIVKMAPKPAVKKQ